MYTTVVAFVFFEGSTDHTGITREASNPIIHPKKTERSCASKAFFVDCLLGIQLIYIP
jgi:hypothetical protein